MLFADDSYLHCKFNVEEATNVLGLLKVFENAMGQKVNLTKPEFFSSNITDMNK